MKNSLSAAQYAIVAIILMSVFKLSVLPSLTAQSAGKDIWMSISMILLSEMISLAFIVPVSLSGGLDAIRQKYGKVVYSLISVPIIVVLIIKTLVYVSEVNAFSSSSAATSMVSLAMFFSRFSTCTLMITIFLLVYLKSSRCMVPAYFSTLQSLLEYSTFLRKTPVVFFLSAEMWLQFRPVPVFKHMDKRFSPPSVRQRPRPAAVSEPPAQNQPRRPCRVLSSHCRW